MASLSWNGSSATAAVDVAMHGRQLPKDVKTFIKFLEPLQEESTNLSSRSTNVNLSYSTESDNFFQNSKDIIERLIKLKKSLYDKDCEYEILLVVWDHLRSILNRLDQYKKRQSYGDAGTSEEREEGSYGGNERDASVGAAMQNAVFEVMFAMADNQFDELSVLRREFLELVRDPSYPVHVRILLLKKATRDGCRLDPFVPEVEDALLKLSNKGSEAPSAFTNMAAVLLRNGFRSFPTSVVETVIGQVNEIAEDAVKDGDTMGCRRCLSVYEAVVQAGILPCNSIGNITGIICHSWILVKHEAHSIMHLLMQTEVKYQTLVSLMKLLEQWESIPTKLICGCINLVSKAVWEDDEYGDAPFTKVSLLKLFYQMRSSEDGEIILQMLLALERLIRYYGPQLTIEWDYVFKVLSAVFHDCKTGKMITVPTHPSAFGLQLRSEASGISGGESGAGAKTPATEHQRVQSMLSRKIGAQISAQERSHDRILKVGAKAHHLSGVSRETRKETATTVSSSWGESIGGLPSEYIPESDEAISREMSATNIFDALLAAVEPIQDVFLDYKFSGSIEALEEVCEIADDLGSFSCKMILLRLRSQRILKVSSRYPSFEAWLKDVQRFLYVFYLHEGNPFVRRQCLHVLWIVWQLYRNFIGPDYFSCKPPTDGDSPDPRLKRKSNPALRETLSREFTLKAAIQQGRSRKGNGNAPQTGSNMLSSSSAINGPPLTTRRRANTMAQTGDQERPRVADQVYQSNVDELLANVYAPLFAHAPVDPDSTTRTQAMSLMVKMMPQITTSALDELLQLLNDIAWIDDHKDNEEQFLSCSPLQQYLSFGFTEGELPRGCDDVVRNSTVPASFLSGIGIGSLLRHTLPHLPSSEPKYLIECLQQMLRAHSSAISRLLAVMNLSSIQFWSDFRIQWFPHHHFVDDDTLEPQNLFEVTDIVPQLPTLCGKCEDINCPRLSATRKAYFLYLLIPGRETAFDSNNSAFSAIEGDQLLLTLWVAIVSDSCFEVRKTCWHILRSWLVCHPDLASVQFADHPSTAKYSLYNRVKWFSDVVSRVLLESHPALSTGHQAELLNHCADSVEVLIQIYNVTSSPGSDEACDVATILLQCVAAAIAPFGCVDSSGVDKRVMQQSRNLLSHACSAVSILVEPSISECIFRGSPLLLNLYLGVYVVNRSPIVDDEYRKHASLTLQGAIYDIIGHFRPIVCDSPWFVTSDDLLLCYIFSIGGISKSFEENLSPWMKHFCSQLLKYNDEADAHSGISPTPDIGNHNQLMASHLAFHCYESLVLPRALLISASQSVDHACISDEEAILKCRTAFEVFFLLPLNARQFIRDFLGEGHNFASDFFGGTESTMRMLARQVWDCARFYTTERNPMKGTRFGSSVCTSDQLLSSPSLPAEVAGFVSGNVQGAPSRKSTVRLFWNDHCICLAQPSVELHDRTHSVQKYWILEFFTSFGYCQKRVSTETNPLSSLPVSPFDTVSFRNRGEEASLESRQYSLELFNSNWDDMPSKYVTSQDTSPSKGSPDSDAVSSRSGRTFTSPGSPRVAFEQSKGKLQFSKLSPKADVTYQRVLRLGEESGDHEEGISRTPLPPRDRSYSTPSPPDHSFYQERYGSQNSHVSVTSPLREPFTLRSTVSELNEDTFSLEETEDKSSSWHGIMKWLTHKTSNTNSNSRALFQHSYQEVQSTATSRVDPSCATSSSFDAMARQLRDILSESRGESETQSSESTFRELQQHFDEEAIFPVCRTMRMLEKWCPSELHKFGVMYISKDATTEEEVLATETIPRWALQFLNYLGETTPTKNCKKYLGGLDNEHNTDGRFCITYESTSNITRIAFHCVHLMLDRTCEDGCTPSEQSSLTSIKRHIGNDFVTIILLEPGAQFNWRSFLGEFNLVAILVQPVVNEFVDAAMNFDFLRISIISKRSLPPFGPRGPISGVADNWWTYMLSFRNHVQKWLSIGEVAETMGDKSVEQYADLHFSHGSDNAEDTPLIRAEQDLSDIAANGRLSPRSSFITSFSSAASLVRSTAIQADISCRLCLRGLVEPISGFEERSRLFDNCLSKLAQTQRYETMGSLQSSLESEI
eukprot:gb/GECG01008613.1/.p1 GENE.gb/GECG01008613.1/~~gb/GECG01008613.1/.p1  ORF type:complete len:2078 (+),score=218.47 gb/GECG01008613.1/:1-6234(+)